MRERTRCLVRSLSAFPSQAYCLDGIWKRVDRCGLRGDHGIAVVHTGYSSGPTIEIYLGADPASARHIVTESNIRPIRRLGSKQWARISVERPWAFWDLGGIGSQVARVGSALE